MRTRVLIILVIMTLWFSLVPRSLPIVHASETETIVLFDETQEGQPPADSSSPEYKQYYVEFFVEGSYNVPSDKKIKSATFTVTVEILSYTGGEYWYFIEFANENNTESWLEESGYRDDVRWSYSKDVTEVVKDYKSFDYWGDVYLMIYPPDHLYEVRARGVLIIELEDTSGGGSSGGERSAPIPVGVVPLIAAEMLWIYRRRKS